MNRLESLFPGTRQTTMQGFEKIAQIAGGDWTPMELGKCQRCSEPCVKDLCKACELLGKLKTIN
jgi:hypothetical protein